MPWAFAGRSNGPIHEYVAQGGKEILSIGEYTSNP
jgi:hypothetical protein